MLIRGTIAYDPPDHNNKTKSTETEYQRARRVRWREANREKVRKYNREYMKKRREAGLC